ncbi:hypothetical protein AAC387_Pa01g0648 [Persea americana]
MSLESQNPCEETLNSKIPGNNMSYHVQELVEIPLKKQGPYILLLYVGVSNGPWRPDMTINGPRHYMAQLASIGHVGPDSGVFGFRRLFFIKGSVRWVESPYENRRRTQGFSFFL